MANSLKTTLILCVLAAVAYAAYVVINRNPDETADGGGLAPDVTGPPIVSIPPSPAAAASTSDFPGAPIEVGMGHEPGTNRRMEVPGGPGGVEQGYPGTPQPYDGGNAPPASVGGQAANQFNPPGPTPVPFDGNSVPGPNPAPPGMQPTVTPGMDFNTVMTSVRRKWSRREHVDALRELSASYGRSDLSANQTRQVVTLLDDWAPKVIYSKAHLLADPYVVSPGETIEDIAAKHHVPWQLLGKINQLANPHNLAPGTVLKVLQGPFRAVVDLESYQLTMMLGDMYAGRFRIGIGLDHAGLVGNYLVVGKMPNPPYESATARFAKDDPNNPYGRFWIGLGTQHGRASDISLHGTPDPSSVGQTIGQGSVRIADQEIEDVYDILSLDSQVTVRR